MQRISDKLKTFYCNNSNPKKERVNEQQSIGLCIAAAWLTYDEKVNQ
jgi:hypothetical protein